MKKLGNSQRGGSWASAAFGRRVCPSLSHDVQNKNKSQTFTSRWFIIDKIFWDAWSNYFVHDTRTLLDFVFLSKLHLYLGTLLP